MQLHAVRITAAHLGNFLTLSDALVFLDQQRLVVRVGRQERIVVLEDDQVAVAAQARTGIAGRGI